MPCFVTSNRNFLGPYNLELVINGVTWCTLYWEQGKFKKSLSLYLFVTYYELKKISSNFLLTSMKLLC